MNIGDRVELELVDPKRNARRGYTLTVLEDPQLALFPGEPAGVVLVLAWGRLEGRRRVQRLRFRDLEALGAKWREVLAVRRRHGYVTSPAPP
jgi:predicted DNA-binding WGR domain protein